MPSLGVSRTHWPVLAWIRLQLPPPEPKVALLGPPPPPDPPLEILTANPVPTDPRRRIFAYEEDRGGWILRLVWDSDEPTILEAEYRAPIYGQRLGGEQVPEFWAAVKERVVSLGPLTILGADPMRTDLRHDGTPRLPPRGTQEQDSGVRLDG